MLILQSDKETAVKRFLHPVVSKALGRSLGYYYNIALLIWTIGGANYEILFLWTAYANDSQQVITVSFHVKFVLIVVVPVGFVSRDFCAKVAFFLLNSRQDVRIKCHTTIYN